MVRLCYIFAVSLTLVKNLTVGEDTDFLIKEIPLTKSLGFSINKRNERNVVGHHFNREFAEWYQEILRVTSKDKQDDEEDAKTIRRIMDDHSMQMLSEGVIPRRHVPSHSAARRRRARSQATRRDKLTNQGVRSHLKHVRHMNPEQMTEYISD